MFWGNFRSSSMKSIAKTTMKPPNIGILNTNAIIDTDNDDYLSNVKSTLSKCINVDRYTFVRLEEASIGQTLTPWSDNVHLIVICGRSSNFRLNDRTIDAFRRHWLRGGNFLDVSASLSFVIDGLFNGKFNCKRSPWTSKTTLSTNTGQQLQLMLNDNLLSIKEGPNLINEDINFNTSTHLKDEDNFIIVGTCTVTKCDMDQSNNEISSAGVVLFSQAPFVMDNVESSLDFWQDLLTKHLHLDCSKTGSSNHLTPAYLITSSKQRGQLFQSSIQSQLSTGNILRGSKQWSLALMADDSKPEVIQQTIPLVMSHCESVPGFDRDIYFDHLSTRELGQVVIYGEVLPSTMDIMSSSIAPHGVTVIAGRQTSGRGRSDHCWLSPEGCAMFSVHIRLSLKSEIGRRPSFVQHLVAMAAVQGIRSIPGYEDLDLRLKWPNDIYYGNSVKIGGLIVQSSLIDDSLICTIGCGLNISNGHPTVCVNDIIRNQCPSLPTLKPEMSIARTLTRFEHLLELFESNGVKAILPQYYAIWLHSNAEVTLSLPGDVGGLSATRKALVQGLDDDGFLVVHDHTGSGTSYSVQPDGNSFDLMHNLVIVRKVSC